MAAHALYHRDQQFIDLTLSDDEDGRSILPQTLSNPSASAVDHLPQSHHGLMLFGSNSGKRHQNGYPFYEDYDSTVPSSQTGSRAGLPGQSRAAPHVPIPYTIGDDSYEEHDLDYLAAGPHPVDAANVRPRYNNARTRTKGRGTRRRELSTGSSNRSNVVIAENNAKRRKIDRAILPGDTVGSSVRAGSHAHTQHVQTVGSSTPVNYVATTPTNNGGTRRSPPAIPDVSKNGRDDTALQNEKLQLMLTTQMFPHIKLAIAQYQQALSGKDREIIGEMTAGALVKDPKFIKDFLANGYKLSEEYENSLALRAKSTVNQYAKEYLEGSDTKFESSRGDPHQLVKSTFRNSSGPRRRSQPARCSSSASEDGDDIFEAQLVEPKQSALRHSTRPREYSSSPATSFSHELNLENDSSPLGSNIQTPQEQPTVFQGPPTNTPVVLVKPATPVQGNDAQGSQKGDLPRNKRRRIGAAERSQMSVRRPYTSFTERNGSPRHGFREHIDFSSEEIEYMCEVIRILTRKDITRESDAAGKIVGLMSSQEAAIPNILDALQKKLELPGQGQGRQLLQCRGSRAIHTFLKDAASGTITTRHRLVTSWSTMQPSSRPSIMSQLRGREFIGLAPLPFHFGQGSFKEKAMSCLEDSLIRISEWTDCCGDIATISWTGENTFVCGAVAHSDYHNMQYNKPGNLCVGSLSLDTLTAISDHRIARPLIGPAENAENALESMRRTQDPWIYTSVVSSSHNEANGFTFTASFDKTVKVWSVSENGSTMDWRGTWEHENNVNFVVTSEYHDLVATAADVCNNAIRVYNFDEENVSDSPYDTYSGDRAREQAQELFRRDKWAYFPATVQWGKAASVSHLLLVGYSPRSVTGHDVDIPEEKKNTGELCIWDVEDTSKVSISSAHSQNVFEVIWHPTQPLFVAATSPAGHFESDTRTQIRLFARKDLGAFFHVKTMDCPALDINELTIMPNSDLDSWVTASCTDGNCYVWDTASHTERPIHVLNHGESLDNPLPELPREIGDEGVKFASWGQSSHRFYTGSSDGRVKAWNIHASPGNALVRHVLEVSGGITAGTFSRDFSKLLIGDATGKVHLLGFDDSDLDEETTDPRNSAGPKRPKIIRPHPEPPPPKHYEAEAAPEDLEKTGQELAMEFIREGRVRLHPDPGIGAVQGPNYAETHYFRLEAHEDGDASKPLLPGFQAVQRYETSQNNLGAELPKLPLVRCSDFVLHSRNLALDSALAREGVDFDWDYKLESDVTPRFTIFGDRRKAE